MTDARPRIRLESVLRASVCERGIDGWVMYEVTHLDGHVSYMGQPFVFGQGDRTPEGRLVWGASGSWEALTLDPSYRCDDGRGAMVHLFFRAGRIELLGDSTVQLDD